MKSKSGEGGDPTAIPVKIRLRQTFSWPGESGVTRTDSQNAEASANSETGQYLSVLKTYAALEAIPEVGLSRFELQYLSVRMCVCGPSKAEKLRPNSCNYIRACNRDNYFFI